MAPNESERWRGTIDISESSVTLRQTAERAAPSVEW
jgi:hypothetical protein